MALMRDKQPDSFDGEKKSGSVYRIIYLKILSATITEKLRAESLIFAFLLKIWGS